jgi:hypothetical protein
MILFADTLHYSLPRLLMRFHIDQEQIGQRHQITDADHDQKTAEERAQGQWQVA